MSKKEIDWGLVPNFSPKEFAEDPNKFSDPKIIYLLQEARNRYQKRIFPSPVKGTVARFGGSPDSQHYVGPSPENITRYSTALDIFPEGIPFEFYTILLGIQGIGGIGVYLHTKGPDGKPWVMFHKDLRDIAIGRKFPLIWICVKIWDIKTKEEKNVYRYPQFEPVYWKLLSSPQMFIPKKFGE